MADNLPPAVAEYVEASNTFDGDRMISAFADDAMVNDARREFWGRDAVRRWLDKEIIGDRVTMKVTAVREHHGTVIVDAVMDGDFDRTNLPDELILTHYFELEEDRIVTLYVIRNVPAQE